MHRTFLQLSALFGLFAVALGAIATHALESRLSPHYLEVFKVGAHYQMVHALALGLVGVLTMWSTDKRLTYAGWCFTAGIVIFSGSLYVLTLTGIKILGAITPLGGVAFMVGWGFLFLSAGKLVPPREATP